MSLLDLPLELRTIIYDLVLFDSSKTHLRICKPSERFSYDDNHRHIKETLARLERHKRRTRLSVKALLPQRPCNPYRSRTGMSLLLACKQLYDEGSVIYYGNHGWELGVHGRTPKVPVFREFLDTIGERNRRCIRTVVLVSRLGYNHLWSGPPLEWARQLQRCENLRTILVSMTGAWAIPLSKRKTFWEDPCLVIWKKQIESLDSVRVWNQSNCDYRLSMQIVVDNLLKQVGFMPKNLPTLRVRNEAQ